jgi:hypothetical protein
MASSVIRKELLLFGQTNVGPILPTTRRTYLIRLKKLRQGKVKIPATCVANFEVDSLKKLGSLFNLDNEMSRRFVELSSDAKLAANFLTRDGIPKCQSYKTASFVINTPTKKAPAGSTKANRREPKSCLGRVKLGHFVIYAIAWHIQKHALA